MTDHNKKQAAITQFIARVKFDERGLVPVIVQDANTLEVLMFAYQNAATLQETLQIGEMIYYSRSRQKRWHKGEQSGHTQQLKSMRLDCDGDVLLATVVQQGGIACHTGRASCFYQMFSDEQAEGVLISLPVIKSPETIYSNQQ